MPAYSLDDLKRVIEKHWGYRAFRPLQVEAMQAVLHGRDSLVVMPTGGGKSLCYQVPALVLDGLTVVVSPLISLMQDQVWAARARGIWAASLTSAMSPAERTKVMKDVERGGVRLLYIAPERLITGEMIGFLRRVPPAMLAVDEAHCVS